MTRRCSHCNGNGHNCRKCPNGGGGGGIGGGGSVGGGYAGVKLFGVRLTDGSIMKKSASMGNLSLYNSSLSAAASPTPGSPSSDRFGDNSRVRDGYDSDDPVHASSSANPKTERKKGIPWTEEEHRLFLMGLQQLGKGEWRSIAKNFVTSRTPTQVASHAQKHFARKANSLTQKRRRSSLFDMVPEFPLDMPDDQHGLPPRSANSSTEELTIHNSQEEDDNKGEPLTFTDLSIKHGSSEPMETTPVGSSSSSSSSVGQNQQFFAPPFMIPYLTFYPAFVPLPFQMWRPVEIDTQARVSQHQILKPTPIKAVNVDELVEMSNLTLRDSGSGLADSSSPDLSLRLTGEASRQSAFHAQTWNSGRNIQREEHN